MRRPDHKAPVPEAPLTVAVLAKRLQGTVEGLTPEPIWVSGEIQDAKSHPSGHLYFTLKDESGDAALDALIYKINVAPRTRELVKNGARVVVMARVRMYVPRGRLQLVIERVTSSGRGALLEAIEQLKQKLAAEGLFARARKRALPVDPRVIGVVTSPKGAAIHDIVRVAERRGGANLLLCPAVVQGASAARSIAWAIEMLNRVKDVDVIIVGRGGGSTDDLMAYNDEHVVRAVAGARAPVVSAVGHDIDVTLVDFAADARAATPSQAAEMVVPDRAARRELFRQWSARLLRAMRGRVTHERAAARELEARLQRLHPGAVLAQQSAELAQAEDRMRAALTARLSRADAKLAQARARMHGSVAARLERARASLGRSAARLDAMSPLAVLGRGYSITTKEGRAVRDASELARGDRVEVRLHAGHFEAEVTRTTSEDAAATVRETK